MEHQHYLVHDMSDQGMHLLTFVFGIAKQTDIDHMKTTIDEISARQDATTKLASKASTFITLEK